MARLRALWVAFPLFVHASALTISQRDGPASLVIPSTLPGNWTYAGCWTDNVPGRVLTGPGFNGNDVSIESCIAFCTKKKQVYAGTEYAGQCYCGNALDPASMSANETQCNMACTANSTEPCGGSNRLTLFNSGSPPPAGPVVNNGPGNWTSLGCYNDTVGSRTLLNNPQTPGGTDNATVALCTTACAQGGYVLAGIEYGGECYCGNVFSNGGGPAPDGSTGCSMTCNGNSSELCGGPNRLNMYTTLGWKMIGCYNDSVNARTFPTEEYLPGGGADMTVGNCTAACQSNNFLLAGLEYAGECYCGNTTSNGGGPASDGDAQCNMPCNGDATELCGGPNRLNVYSFRGDLPTASMSTSSTGSTAAPTVTAASSATIATSNPATTTAAAAQSTSAQSTSSAPTNTALPKGWSYAGCYVDNANNGRDFNNQQPDDSNLTIQSCITTCSANNYSIAAMEYSVQCFCDNFIRNGGALASSDSQCNMACGGNSNEMCGSGNRLSVYSIGPVQVYVPPAPQKTGLPGKWAYQGCVTDAAGSTRTFPYQLILAHNNTAPNCLSQCQEFGYGAAGLEYGEECFCGDALDITANNRTFAPESDCSMTCTGNSSYICGAGDRLSYYEWMGEPLTSINYANGTAAGAYEFLIGGVVVPLVTQPAPNGKVTFLEKFGTGPPNSTGAYELDLAQLGNFTGAWRPMHVKTDVFCSASLTLPDRVGRQINVGGWAYPSTTGVRLYWPDGSPGVWGTNDWQENYEEVSLQVGRWYPTAMIMANGSILVVGGEEGSNGAPVPSLEILPLPAGASTQYCDYLNRTDPYNLYPFLAVLPSGNIFIQYYNEARLLDPVSLQTVQQLPNVPAAVNDFLGGRNYPMSGTMALMPQYAPYSDPLTVVICGGSTPGPEYALDNCVSIQPDVANATWTIERMPSRRVMPCIAALPDGTYLILNGAVQGFAGFGLANDPNLNAVLYDPSKPVNNRMTSMNSSTIARLYHSEAVLLDDGRVLVSGSDPEDQYQPEEYRVEVFLPPYLLSGATRPTFTIVQTDWSYGSSYAFQSSVENPVVSLIGADASTHGNSMGQRTIFPAVSCSGTSCTVTAPPGPNVCPPAWFRMFVLDGPTPSNATWVRIGGDPADLGNWPNFPDFTIPGM